MKKQPQKFWFKVVLWTVSAAIHMIFHIGNEKPLSTIIAPSAIEAAINFIEVFSQHAAYITGAWKD